MASIAFHVAAERRAIVFPTSHAERNVDARDLLIAQQIRRVDELERQVDMLKAMLHAKKQSEESAASALAQ